MTAFQMGDINTVLPKACTPKYPVREKDDETKLMEQTVKKMDLPLPAHNGGWYTGESFHPSIAPQPLIPDIGYMTHYAARSADYRMHPARLYQYPGGAYRPGSYHPVLPGVKWYKDYNILCQPGCFSEVPQTDCRETRGSGGGLMYTYIN